MIQVFVHVRVSEKVIVRCRRLIGYFSIRPLLPISPFLPHYHYKLIVASKAQLTRLLFAFPVAPPTPHFS